MRDELKAALNKMVVSHKPDHGIEGQLHEDTAYGVTDDEDGNLVYRKSIDALNDNEIDRIRDRKLRAAVRAHVDAEKKNGVALADALRKLKDGSADPQFKHGLRHVRILKKENPAYLVPIGDRATGATYKAYSAGENFCVDVFETTDGKWNGEAVRRFDANKRNAGTKTPHEPQWRTANPDAKLVMRIHKGDLIRLEHDGRTRIMVVHRLDAAASRFKLADHNETGNLDRRHATDNEIDPFRWLMASYGKLKKLGAIPIRVDELGRPWRIRKD